MSAKPVFLIVGASLAGAKAAEELRTRGFDGRVVLIGAEPERPYERPPLTKDYLRGESERVTAYVHEADFYAKQEIDLWTGARVIAIEAGASRVRLDDGRTLGYDRLLLATGAEPRRIPVPGADLDGVCYLRTLADCDLLRERLEVGGRVVVVGAGWIGSEIGAFYRDVHDQHGITLLLGDEIDSFQGNGSVERVRTARGAVIGCDFAVVGIGVVPRVGLASVAGLEVDNGVV